MDLYRELSWGKTPGSDAKRLQRPEAPSLSQSLMTAYVFGLIRAFIILVERQVCRDRRQVIDFSRKEGIKCSEQTRSCSK